LQSAVWPPQPSLCSPQVVEGKFAQVRGVHAPPSKDVQMLNSQVCPFGHVGHVISVPQPLSVRPHWMPSCAHVCGTQALPASTGTQWLAEQLVPFGHVPHSAVTPPHPLAP
jgi:hypothetical protein